MSGFLCPHVVVSGPAGGRTVTVDGVAVPGVAEVVTREWPGDLPSVDITITARSVEYIERGEDTA